MEKSNFYNYIIIKCYHCGLIQYVLKKNKTRKCPKCNKIIDISKTIKLNKVKTLQEAIRLTQAIKMGDKDSDTFRRASSLSDK